MLLHQPKPSQCPEKKELNNDDQPVGCWNTLFLNSAFCVPLNDGSICLSQTTSHKPNLLFAIFYLIWESRNINTYPSPLSLLRSTNHNRMKISRMKGKRARLAQTNYIALLEENSQIFRGLCGKLLLKPVQHCPNSQDVN